MSYTLYMLQKSVSNMNVVINMIFAVLTQCVKSKLYCL